MKHIQKLRKLILTLGILAGMSLTAYAADTTITWTNPRLHIVEVNKSHTQSGITVTMTTAPKSSGGWMGDSIMVFEGTGTFVFSSSVGNIKGVVITAKNVHYSNNDWSMGNDRTTLTWSGTPASSVTLSGNQFDIQRISSIVFTIEGANVDVTGVTLNKTSTTLAAGGTETLTATVSPEDATDKTVTWSSDNTSVATVDANGKVTAASAGTANITATATNGTDDTSDDKTATCTVTVTAEKSVTFTNNGTQDGITVKGNYLSGRGDNCFYISSEETLTISSGNYDIIKLEVTDEGHYTGRFNDSHITVSTGNKSIQGIVLTVTDINAKSVTLSATDSLYWTTNKIVVYYEEVTGPDKTALNEAITAAETLYNSIKAVEDYSDIAATLSTAIDAAKDVAYSDTADQNEVDATTTAITTAKTNAEAAKKDVDDTTAAANAVIEKINALPASDAITSANKDAIKAARAAYDALTDNQKAKIGDTVKNKLKAAETALVAAELNEYKEAQKTAAENKAQDGDSDATNALITAAKATIDALTYDATKTLAENKAAVTAVVTQLATDLAAQRAAEQPVTVAAKADPSTTGTYYATFYDSTKSYTADCEVYYATANANGRLTLQKTEGNVIKAGEGVILKATSETVTLTPTTTEASYDSLLTGSNRETTVENALVLSLGKNGVWFYKYSGTLGANKAYLAQQSFEQQFQVQQHQVRSLYSGAVPKVWGSPNYFKFTSEFKSAKI